MSKIGALFLAFVMIIGCVGCSPQGPSDEEIIGQLGEKFMIALYRGDTETAKKICNKTGYDTFEQLSGMFALVSMGMNGELDEAVVAGKIDLIEVKMLSETKGIAKVLDTFGDEPKSYTIPAEKDADGNWKVAVTKQSFN